MAGKKNMHHRKLSRQTDAKVRIEARQNRSDKEQLKVLDSRLGKNLGAKKERIRLNKNIKQTKKTKTTSEKQTTEKTNANA